MPRTIVGPRALAIGGLFSVLCMAAPNPAAANLIMDTSIGLSGTGCGNVDCILVIQDNGSPPPQDDLQNNDIESGCVGRQDNQAGDFIGPDHCLYDVEGGDEQAAQSNTVLAGDIDGLTSFADLAIVFNIAETGGDLEVDLDNIYLAIFSDDDELLFSAAFDESGTLNAINLAIDSGTGVGTSGFAFILDAVSAAEAGSIPFDATYRIGGGIELVEDTTSNGPDTVFLVSVPGTCTVNCDPPPPPCSVNCDPPPPPCEVGCDPEPDPNPNIPEPGALTLFGIGLAGLGWVNRRRKTKQA